LSDFPDRKTAREEVFDLSRKHNIARSLVEAHESDIKMSESDVVHFAAGFDNRELPPDYRLACVVATDTKDDRRLEIIISLDGVNVKYFLERDAALMWLLAV